MKPVSLRTRLIFLASTSATAGILVTCAVLLHSHITTIRQSRLKQLYTLSEILAFNSSAVIQYEHAEGAKNLLNTFHHEPAVVHASLSDANGKLLAEYQLPGDVTELIGESIDLTLPVRDGKKVIGILRLTATLADIRADVVHLIYLTLIVGVVAILIVSLLSLILQGKIATPITHLAELARKMTTQKDYSLRVVESEVAEIGDLQHAFNNLLDCVDQTKSELCAANESLERRVEERTEQLVLARDAAETANRAKSHFLANMSHEIRTPMNAILGFTDMLRRNWEEDQTERMEMLSTIHDSGQHLLSLINDILDLSKVESGRMELELRRENPHALISGVISMMRVPCRKKNLTLEYNWTSPIPETILTDGIRLKQILVNLISNAMKFTERGGIQLLAYVETKESPQLVVDVVDTGIGIPPEKQNCIFDAFVQADSSVKRKYGGTGLGLSISRQLAQAMGGDLAVESKEGEGSTFTVKVNIGPASELKFLEKGPMGDYSIQRSLDTPKPEPRLAGRKVLIVDDGETNRKLLSLVLRKMGMVVDLAENGQIGCDKALGESFDIILMDMQMPVLDGYEATAQLRKKGVQVPILALTAHAMQGDEQKCLAIGCTGYIPKPIDIDELASVLQSLLTNDGSEASPVPVETPETFAALPWTPLSRDEEFQEIAQEFADSLGDRLAGIFDAVEQHDAKRLSEFSHWLRGAAGTVGFHSFTSPAEELSRAVKQDRWDDTAEILDRMKNMHGRIQFSQQIPVGTNI